MHSTLQATPGSIVYQRDMLLPLQCFAHWESIRLNREQSAIKNLLRENSKRTHFDWQPGMEVLLTNFDKNKLQSKVTGPFRIARAHTNGTVTLRDGRKTFRVNIRRLRPYRCRPNN